MQPLTDDRIGSCVDGTCGDIEVGYEVAAETFNACQSDDDCTLYSPLNDCCGGFAVNDEGVYAMQQIDGFASRTSCGRDWAETCTMVDCAEPPSDAVACVQGRCQRADF